MKYIATDNTDAVVMVDDSGQIQWVINPDCPEWADYQQWRQNPDNQLIEAQPSEFHRLAGDQWRVDAPTARKYYQQLNREECRSRILARYPLEIQSSMAAGIYTTEEIEEYQSFLAALIAEENRVFDLLETVEDPTTVENPDWSDGEE